jgi:molybdate transport system regulatory protein
MVKNRSVPEDIEKMAPPPGPARRKAVSLLPRFKVWLELDDCYAFGRGLADILQAVDRAGSIKQAAADLGKSYRYVWGRIKEAEQTLGWQLVEAHVGGHGVQRSSLTPDARDLVAAFVAFRGKLAAFVKKEFDRHFPR